MMLWVNITFRLRVTFKVKANATVTVKLGLMLQ